MMCAKLSAKTKPNSSRLEKAARRSEKPSSLVSYGLLDSDALLRHGYIADGLIPSISSETLANAAFRLRTIIGTNRNPRSRAFQHSVPKRKHFRRLKSIPNPVHQIALADVVEKHWEKLERFCWGSSLSVSKPQVNSTGDRALEANMSLDEIAKQRLLRSIGRRVCLRADIARFYPSIYTHSIPWALHGKAESRRNAQLYGNSIDKALRDTQDQQTGGIPIGPDTSFLMGEVIGTAIDHMLSQETRVTGTRYLDDFHLYFYSTSEAEHGLSVLHKAVKAFELELNEAKTAFYDLPELLEPVWKTELRQQVLLFGLSPASDGSAKSLQHGF